MTSTVAQVTRLGYGRFHMINARETCYETRCIGDRGFKTLQKKMRHKGNAYFFATTNKYGQFVIGRQASIEDFKNAKKADK